MHTRVISKNRTAIHTISGLPAYALNLSLELLLAGGIVLLLLVYGAGSG
jgi:hypothetical protein